jgi:hypothetical protein
VAGKTKIHGSNVMNVTAKATCQKNAPTVMALAIQRVKFVKNVMELENGIDEVYC